MICGPVGEFEGGKLYIVREGDRVTAREVGRMGEAELTARVLLVYRLRAI